MDMKVIPGKGRDDTIDPMYLGTHGRLALGSTGTPMTDTEISDAVRALQNKVSSLQTTVNSQGNKITILESSQHSQDGKIESLEDSQEVQDNNIETLSDTQEELEDKIAAIIGDDIPASVTTVADFTTWIVTKGYDLKTLANSSGGTTTIINYASSLIGADIPNDIKDDPDAVLSWLQEQDDGKGIDLKSLSERLTNIETNLLDDDDIDDIVGSLP